jgi:hypothetical protein
MVAGGEGAEVEQPAEAVRPPEGAAGRFCAQCGQRLADGARFCAGCGTVAQ